MNSNDDPLPWEEGPPLAARPKARPSKKNRRSSILKVTTELVAIPERNPLKEISNSPKRRASLSRRVSFSASNFVKEFCTGKDELTVWNTTYEEERDSSSSCMKSTILHDQQHAASLVEDSTGQSSNGDVEEVESSAMDITTFPDDLSEVAGDDEVFLSNKKSMEITRVGNVSMEMTCALSKLMPSQMATEVEDATMKDTEEVDGHMEMTCQVANLRKPEQPAVAVDDDVTSGMEMTCHVPPTAPGLLQTGNKDDVTGNMEMTCQVPKSERLTSNQSDEMTCQTSKLSSFGATNTNIISQKAWNQTICHDDITGRMEMTCQVPKPPVPSTVCAQREMQAYDDVTGRMDFTCHWPSLSTTVGFKVAPASFAEDGMEMTCKVPKMSTTSNDEVTGRMEITCQVPKISRTVGFSATTVGASTHQTTDMEMTSSLIPQNVIRRNDDLNKTEMEMTCAVPMMRPSVSVVDEDNNAGNDDSLLLSGPPRLAFLSETNHQEARDESVLGGTLKPSFLSGQDEPSLSTNTNLIVPTFLIQSPEVEEREQMTNMEDVITTETSENVLLTDVSMAQASTECAAMEVTLSVAKNISSGDITFSSGNLPASEDMEVTVSAASTVNSSRKRSHEGFLVSDHLTSSITTTVDESKPSSTTNKEPLASSILTQQSSEIEPVNCRPAHMDIHCSDTSIASTTAEKPLIAASDMTSGKEEVYPAVDVESSLTQQQQSLTLSKLLKEKTVTPTVTPTVLASPANGSACSMTSSVNSLESVSSMTSIHSTTTTSSSTSVGQSSHRLNSGSKSSADSLPSAVSAKPAPAPPPAKRPRNIRELSIIQFLLEKQNSVADGDDPHFYGRFSVAEMNLNEGIIKLGFMHDSLHLILRLGHPLPSEEVEDGCSERTRTIVRHWSIRAMEFDTNTKLQMYIDADRSAKLAQHLLIMQFKSSWFHDNCPTTCSLKETLQKVTGVVQEACRFVLDMYSIQTSHCKFLVSDDYRVTIGFYSTKVVLAFDITIDFSRGFGAVVKRSDSITFSNLVAMGKPVNTDSILNIVKRIPPGWKFLKNLAVFVDKYCNELSMSVN